MPLITSAVLLDISDRAAFQYEQIKDAFDLLTPVGGGLYQTLVTATNDVDVEIPTLEEYKRVDDTLLLATAIANGTPLPKIVTAMDAHFSRVVSGSPLQIGSWDGFLGDKDERVSYWFSLIYLAAKSSRMLAVNVFSEGDDEFSDITVSGAGTVTVVDGVNYGDGAVTNPADGNNYAATQLKLKVISMASAECDFRISVKDVNDNPTTIDVNVPVSADDTEIDIGTASSRFLDVTGVAFVPGGPGLGTIGDNFKIFNKIERTIAL